MFFPIFAHFFPCLQDYETFLTSARSDSFVSCPPSSLLTTALMHFVFGSLEALNLATADLPPYWAVRASSSLFRLSFLTS